MLHLMRDLEAKNGKFSIKNWIAPWNMILKICSINGKSPEKSAKSVSDIGNFWKIQFLNVAIFARILQERSISFKNLAI